MNTPNSIHLRDIVFAVLLLPLVAGCGASDSGDEVAPTRAVAVRTAAVEQRGVQTRLHSIGRLVSENTPLLSAEVNARVVEVLVDEGVPVEEGQVLVRLDKTTFELSRQEAQAAILTLQVSIANEQRRVNRYRDLKSTNAMSQERLDDAEAKLAADRASMAAAEARLAIVEDRLSKTELVTPVHGIVERRHVSVGDYVQTGNPMITVTDIYHLRARLPFPETVGHMLKPGQKLILESPVAPGVKLEARIDQIRPQVGAASRSLVAIAEVDNPGQWRPEAAVEATVIVDDRPDALAVPYNALVQRPAGDVVYVLEGDSVREQVVEPGERQNGLVEIRKGLEKGQRVVSDGAHYLSDGAMVVVRDEAT
jgi:RND family efflux transporter MFP subunit